MDDDDYRLTFENFETMLDPVILERGRDYYRSGNVIDLMEEDSVWTATVVGTYEYEVEVVEDSDDGLLLSCDCPYEWGPYCKHEAATLFAIRAERRQGKATVKPKKAQRDSIRKVVENLSHEQLVEIVLNQIKKDRTLGNQILLEYGADAPDKTLYERSIKDTLRKRQDRGFLDYRETQLAAREIGDLLNQAEKMIGEGKPGRALPILKAVIETVPEALQGADDSAGELSGCVEGALNLIEDMTADLDADAKQALFEYFLAEVPKPQYQGWDYPRDFLWHAGELVETQAQRETFFAALDRFIAEVRHDWIGDYDQEHVVRLKQEVMQRMGDPPEAIHALLLKNVHLDRPRRQLIQMYIEQEQFAAARDLCLEAIAKYEQSRLPGLVTRYRDLLLQIARQDSDPAAVVHLAEKLLLESHDFEEYYGILKQYVTLDEWPAAVRRIIEVVQKQEAQWQRESLLGQIYQREQMWPELLDLARRSAGQGMIEQYKNDLHRQFPDEMCDIYERMVLRGLEHTTGRDHYRQMAGLLKRMIDLGQPDRVGELIELLKAEYPNRRAMIEELNRVSA